MAPPGPGPFRPLGGAAQVLRQFDVLTLLPEQAALLRCLRDVWWAQRAREGGHGGGEQDMDWWQVVDPWWTGWWDAVRGLEGQLRQFRGRDEPERLPEHFEYFLGPVAACLTEFLQSYETRFGGLEGSVQQLAKEVAIGVRCCASAPSCV